MPGKSTYPDQHLTGSMASVFPVNVDEIHPGSYRQKPASSMPSQSARQQGDSRPRQTGPDVLTGGTLTTYPAPSLLAMELLRIDRALDNHAADARQRDDLPECWIHGVGWQRIEHLPVTGTSSGLRESCRDVEG